MCSITVSVYHFRSQLSILELSWSLPIAVTVYGVDLNAIAVSAAFARLTVRSSCPVSTERGRMQGLFLRRSRPLHLGERAVLAGGDSRPLVIFLSIKNKAKLIKLYVIFASRQCCQGN